MMPVGPNEGNQSRSLFLMDRENIKLPFYLRRSLIYKKLIYKTLGLEKLAAFSPIYFCLASPSLVPPTSSSSYEQNDKLIGAIHLAKFKRCNNQLASL